MRRSFQKLPIGSLQEDPCIPLEAFFILSMVKSQNSPNKDNQEAGHEGDF